MSDELKQILEGRGLEGLKKTIKPLVTEASISQITVRGVILRQFARLPKNRTKLMYLILTDVFRNGYTENDGSS